MALQDCGGCAWGRTLPSSVKRWIASLAMHRPTGCWRPVPLLTSRTLCIALPAVQGCAAIWLVRWVPWLTGKPA
jgi:hypothetical protein